MSKISISKKTAWSLILKINSKISLANIEYKPSSPLYNSKPSKIFFSK